MISGEEPRARVRMWRWGALGFIGADISGLDHLAQQGMVIRQQADLLPVHQVARLSPTWPMVRWPSAARPMVRVVPIPCLVLSAEDCSGGVVGFYTLNFAQIRPTGSWGRRSTPAPSRPNAAQDFHRQVAGPSPAWCPPAVGHRQQMEPGALLDQEAVFISGALPPRMGKANNLQQGTSPPAGIVKFSLSRQ